MSAQSVRIPRAEIERLCLLHAVGPLGCTPEELPRRLGLSSGLVGALTEAAEDMVDLGLMVLDEDRFRVTYDAWDRLQQRLNDLGFGAGEV